MTDSAAKIRTEYWPKPIPYRGGDWSAIAGDYDEGSPIGWGATEQEAIDNLKQQMEENA